LIVCGLPAGKAGICSNFKNKMIKSWQPSYFKRKIAANNGLFIFLAEFFSPTKSLNLSCGKKLSKSL
jgi:hypothetical protein